MRSSFGFEEDMSMFRSPMMNAGSLELKEWMMSSSSSMNTAQFDIGGLYAQMKLKDDLLTEREKATNSELE